MSHPLLPHPICSAEPRDSPRNRIRVRADMLIKMKGTLLLKWLAVFCVLDNVGAFWSGPAASSAPPTSPPSTDQLLEALLARTAKLEATVVLHAAELELHAAELEGVRGECEDKLEKVRQHVGMVAAARAAVERAKAAAAAAAWAGRKVLLLAPTLPRRRHCPGARQKWRAT